MKFSMHDIASIELCSTMLSNSACRIIRATSGDGEAIEFTFFGDTTALDALPKSQDFIDYDAAAIVRAA
jgi:hypothetical protein